MKTILLAALCLLGALFFSLNAQSGQRFTAIDMHSMKRVGNPVPSPKGDYAVYTVKYWNSSTRKSATNLELVLVNTTSSSAQRIKVLTTPKEGQTDFSPVFSNDGRYVFFLSTRAGDNVQIFSIPVHVTEPESYVQQISKFPVDVDNLKISPNGQFFTFSAEVYIDCDQASILECTAQRDAQFAARGANTGILYTQLYVRHWDKWETPGKHPHIFMLPIQSAVEKDNRLMVSAAGPVDLMAGMNAASPIPPFGGAEQYDISPNGEEVAFTAEITATSAVAWTTGWKVYTVATKAGSTPQSITEFTKARTQQPVYSPDGRFIAYLAMDREGLESDRLHVNIYDRVARSTNPVTGKIDISFGNIEWLSDGKTLLLDADDDGEHKLYSFDITSGQLTVLIATDHNDGAVQVPGVNRVVLGRNSFNAPTEIFQFDITMRQENGEKTLAVSNLMQITNYNTDRLSKLFFGRSEKFYFTGANNDRVQGWLIQPRTEGKSGPFPLAFLVHGGPEGSWASSWSYRWNPQLWANRGYVVVMINPHGSTGFGQNFTDAVRTRWGSWPFEDLMTGFDYVADKYSNLINKDKACACGASYGGYMMNYINGRDTGKFKCLVNHDGLFDNVAMAYATEELWFSEAENGGTPYENLELFEKYNPRNLVKTMNTPMLVVHGGNDFRIPISEGLSTFTALQRRGIPSKFLYFTQENHWVLKPENSLMWYDTVLGWLDQWTA